MIHICTTDECDLGVQVTVRHGWYGLVRGVVVFDDPSKMPPRVRAMAAWARQRLFESGREVSHLTLSEVRSRQTETQVTFHREIP